MNFKVKYKAIKGIFKHNSVIARPAADPGTQLVSAEVEDSPPPVPSTPLDLVFSFFFADKIRVSLSAAH